MSKLGVHVSAGNRRGFGDFLKKCADAGSPVAAVQSVGQNIWDDVQRYSPDTAAGPCTFVCFRTQTNAAGKSIGDAPQAIYRGDPVVEAQNWMEQIMPVWRINRAHAYAPINEQDGGPASDMDWLNAFLLRCIHIAEREGFTIAGPNSSTGNPRDDSLVTRIVNLFFAHRVPVLAERLNLSVTKSRASAAALGVITPGSAEDRWQRLLPALQAMKAGHHILTLHQYSLDRGTLMASAPYLALRHRRDIAFLSQYNAVPKILINEANQGVGGVPKNSAQWLADLKAYDAELMRDKGVIAACVYTLGGSENIVGALPALGTYIAATPTPIDPGDIGQTVRITLTGLEQFEHVVDPSWTSLKAVLTTAKDVNARIE